MKQMVRGAIAILALSGLAACVDDPLLDINGSPREIQANPTVMLVKQGDSSAVLLRLINEANNSVPTTFTISNVGAGISVNLDRLYRPEFINGSDTLVVPEVKSQQRYFIRGVTPGEYNYTVTSQGITGTFKVRVEPINLGAALSRTTGVAGDAVIITAPTGTTFTPTATVAFATGSNAIQTRAANGKSITVLVGPGVTGAATVAGVTLDYYPSLPALTLVTTNTMTTPALTTAPFTFSASTALTPVTVTATGFKFRPSFTLRFGDRQAWVVSVAADSNSAVVVIPTGLAGATPIGSNVALSFLPTVALTNLNGTNPVTTAATTSYNGANPDGTAAVINAAAPGTIVDFYDTGDINYGADILANGGPNKWYRLVLPSAGNRTYTVGWTSAADIDFYLTDNAIATAFVARFTTANPEVGSTNQPAGNYWIGISNFGGAYPAIVRVRIQ
jgi:hypothetical protein